MKTLTANRTLLATGALALGLVFGNLSSGIMPGAGPQIDTPSVDPAAVLTQRGYRSVPASVEPVRVPAGDAIEAHNRSRPTDDRIVRFPAQPGVESAPQHARGR